MRSIKSLASKIIPHKYHPQAKNIEHYLYTSYLWMRTQKVYLTKLLWGDDAGIAARKYSRLTKNVIRPSTPLSETPHVKLLELYNELGEDIFQNDILEKTKYFANAREIIELTGSYFSCKRPEEIHKQVRFFIDKYRGSDLTHPPTAPGHTPLAHPPRVRPVRASGGFYQIIDGHHRLAIAYCKGVSKMRVSVNQTAVYTPLQQLLLDGLWTGDERILYQPVSAPEVQGWPLVRRCVDRGDKMSDWLARHRPSYFSPDHSYLDIGSSYGWFVKHMLDHGFDARGVERDICAIEVGQNMYGLSRDRVCCKEIQSFLHGCKKKYDVVSCFSVLHHFALGRAAMSAAEMMKLIDDITADVLFFDTGQAGEAWFRNTLSEWTPGFIEGWIAENSSFSKIERLGPDEDRRPPYEQNYGRMLFVCTRDI